MEADFQRLDAVKKLINESEKFRLLLVEDRVTTIFFVLDRPDSAVEGRGIPRFQMNVPREMLEEEDPEAVAFYVLKMAEEYIDALVAESRAKP